MKCLLSKLISTSHEAVLNLKHSFFIRHRMLEAAELRMQLLCSTLLNLPINAISISSKFVVLGFSSVFVIVSLFPLTPVTHAQSTQGTGSPFSSVFYLKVYVSIVREYLFVYLDASN